ncbi:unnamed protein product [Closterium sp. NIES-53]
MDVWGPARVSGQSRERYFLLVVDDYTRYTMVFPLRSKGQVVDVLIPWIRTVRLQLHERSRQDLPVLRLHSDRGGEFSSNLLRDFCRGEGILQSFTIPDSPQQNRIAECRIGLVMETGEFGDASVFRVWGSRAFVRDTSADKLSPRAIPCVFLGFVPTRLAGSFTTPPRAVSSLLMTSRLTSRFPFTVSSPTALPLPRPRRSSLLPDPLPPQGPAPSGVSQVNHLPGPAPVQVAVGSGAARGAASGGAASGGAEPGGAESEGAETGGAERGGVETGGAEPGGTKPEGVEPRGAASEGAESGGAEPQGATSSGGSAGASPRLSPQQLREWFVRHARLRSGATGAGGAGAARAGGAGVAAGAGVTGGTATTGPGGSRTWGTGAAGTGGVEGAGAGDPTESGATSAGGSGACGVGAGGAGVGDTGAGGAGAGGAGAVDPGGAVRPRPYFVPLLQQVLGTPSATGITPPLLCPPPDQSQPPLQPASPLPAPSPYTEQSGSLTERREPASRPVSPIRTARRVPRSRPPPVPGTQAMTLRPSSVPLRVHLPAPPKSSLPEVPDPESDRARAASPTTTALVAESTSASPPSVGGECALSTHVLEDRQEDFGCLAFAIPRFASMLLAPEGDPDAPNIPTPRSYAEAITGPYSSQWQAAMDAEMASWKSTGTFVDEVPPPGANIVDGMWIFRVKRPQGSSPAFKARYVARGFSQRQEWSLRRPVYGLRQAPREWHDTLKTTLAALGFARATADPSLFLRTDTSLPPFYVLVYVLQRFGFEFSSPQSTPLSTSHSLSAPSSDESVEPSGPYPELVGCLITSGMGLVLGGRGPVVLTGFADASWVDDSATQRSSQGYTFSLGSGSVSWRSTRSSSVLILSCEAEIYAGAMAAQELRWLTYLLTDLGEQPRSPPVRYVDNKAMITLCQEH